LKTNKKSKYSEGSDGSTYSVLDKTNGKKALTNDVTGYQDGSSADKQEPPDIQSTVRIHHSVEEDCIKTSLSSLSMSL
jgi:hypothetical protein